ncbi:hypothetical protein FZEAL_4679 [Fusarium zealandicum]|uniref:Short-chain dehydrogenase n=1 Tax=Fusarium zealandicum TaxID=1053134 RepID=A0A8H4ULB5_9HYPO|nr:hypothetical protein FZEAL_4679 [Fusarium zealandicum]
MSANLNIMRQSFFAGTPKFTQKDVPDLSGKVMIVTGSNTGVGKQVTQILYARNAKVYMMARSVEKNNKAREDIQAACPTSSGELICLPLDLADIPSVQSTAAEFLRREDKLHVLFNNAGVGWPELGSKSKQGYELQLGVNCLGSFALTQQLTPTLASTAKTAPEGTVRVVWTSSTAALATPTKNFMERINVMEGKGTHELYCLSKLGNYFHATEYAARHKQDGIVSISLNPGNLDSELWRSQGAFFHWFLRKTLLHPTINGAYTTLFSGLSPQITLEKSGTFIAPWGRLWSVPHDMASGSKLETEGGTGIAKRFWEWTEAQVKLHTSSGSK